MPLLLAMTATALLAGLGAIVVLGTMTETAIAATFREGSETFYSAEAAVEFIVGELAATADWDPVVTGRAVSAFADGEPSGQRRVGTTVLDLVQTTEDVNVVGAGLFPDMRAPYVLYAYGRLANLLPAIAIRRPTYVLVWVVDISNEGAEDTPRVLSIFGRAYGPTGGQRSIAVSISRNAAPAEEGPQAVAVLSWREVR